jgi:hypothetical protein
MLYLLMTLGALDQSRIVWEQLQYISIHDLRSLLSSASITVFFSSKYISMLNGLCHTATDQNQLWSNLRRSQLDTREKWAYFVLAPEGLLAVYYFSEYVIVQILQYGAGNGISEPRFFKFSAKYLESSWLNVFLCCCYDSSIMFCLSCLHLAENYGPNLADNPNLAPPPFSK